MKLRLRLAGVLVVMRSEESQYAVPYTGVSLCLSHRCFYIVHYRQNISVSILIVQICTLSYFMPLFSLCTWTKTLGSVHGPLGCIVSTCDVVDT